MGKFIFFASAGRWGELVGDFKLVGGVIDASPKKSSLVSSFVCCSLLVEGLWSGWPGCSEALFRRLIFPLFANFTRSVCVL